MGQREAAYIIAHKPALTQAYAQQFMVHNGLLPSAETGMSAEGIQNDYAAETRHGAYVVSSKPLDEVRAQAGGLTLHAQTSTVRNDVKAMQEGDRAHINQEAGEVFVQASEVQDTIHLQQQKGVVGRVSEKGVGEAKRIAKDSWDNLMGEPQQK